MDQEYKIGMVAKATGISVDTLRVWERRYAVVEPSRTDGGGRLYSEQDVARLRLIKRLIDNGDAISNLASLPFEALQKRLEDALRELAPATEQRPLRLIAVGSTLCAQLDREHENLHGLELVEEYRLLAELESSGSTMPADVLFVELSTIHDSSVLALKDLMARLTLQHVFVIYRFASRQVLGRLQSKHITALKGPLEIATLNDLCLSISGAWESGATAPAEVGAPGQRGPRRFDDEALDRIASMTPVIECECPRHLADLLYNLSAFEQYSAECENRNEQDAQLHAYLNQTAGQARQLIEAALVKVIEAEGIRL